MWNRVWSLYSVPFHRFTFASDNGVLAGRDFDKLVVSRGDRVVRAVFLHAYDLIAWAQIPGANYQRLGHRLLLLSRTYSAYSRVLTMWFRMVSMPSLRA